MERKAKILILGPLISVISTFGFLVALELGARFLPPITFLHLPEWKKEAPHFSSDWEIPNSIDQLQRPQNRPDIFVSNNLLRSNNFRDSSISPAWPLKKNFEGMQKIWDAETGQVYSESKVHTDLQGRRRAWPADQIRPGQVHLLFMGCSLTFGEGLNDEETLPWKMNRLQQKFNAYNLALSGSGPNHLWVGIHDGSLLESIPEKQGIALYVFFEPQLFRAMGSMREAGWGGEPAIVESQGRYRWAGTFRELYPLRTWFFDHLSKSRFVQRMEIDLPLSTEETDDQFAGMIADIRRQYFEKFSPANKFVFIFYPNHFGDRHDHLRLVHALEKHKIKFLDYSGIDFRELVDGVAEIEGDGHPNAAANEAFAKLLIRDLGLDGGFSESK